MSSYHKALCIVLCFGLSCQSDVKVKSSDVVCDKKTNPACNNSKLPPKKTPSSNSENDSAPLEPSPNNFMAYIARKVEQSKCLQYTWKNRGKAPAGYVKGVALTFARAVCDYDTVSFVKVVGQAQQSNPEKDVLAWYQPKFATIKLDNSTSSRNTLRNVYVLLLGLGMRESSGKHCCGRDASASNTSAETAEAGAWQTSYNARAAHPELLQVFETYKKKQRECFLDVFKQNVTCPASDWQNWGSGEGVVFQKLSKECPAFAAEFAAIVVRFLGGSKGHYGPLRRQEAEINMDCHNLFAEIQDDIENQPSLCQAFAQ